VSENFRPSGEAHRSATDDRYRGSASVAEYHAPHPCV